MPSMNYIRLPEKGRPTDKFFRYRLLVLQAKRFPYLTPPDSTLIFTPRLVSGCAAHEITAFENEPDYQQVAEEPGPDKRAWVFAFLCLLLLWDTLRHTAANWHLSFLPYNAQTWVDLGGLERARVLSGEWWRIFTALTLHADAAHVLGNCVFGALFLLPLCRRAGLGAGIFLAVFGGALGNACNLLFQAPGSVSIGFSTSVFAALGALCGLSAHAAITPGPGNLPVGLRRSGINGKELFVSLAVGLAFLAFLGGSGEERIDFSAHVLGLFGGLTLALGLCRLAVRAGARHSGTLHSSTLRAAARFPLLALSGRAQVLLLAAALILPVISWRLAFAN